jgi:hypothetical protein
MNAFDYDGKRFAVLVMGTDHDGKDEWVKFFGTATYDGTALLMDRGTKGDPFQIRDEWLDRIEPVPDALRDMFPGADYWLRLTSGPLPPETDDKDYVPTGLKVPKDDSEPES